MPNGAEAQGYKGRLMISTDNDFSDGIWLEFLSESLVPNYMGVNSAGMRGTREHASERTRTGQQSPGGQITFEMTRVMLDNFLPGALGASESTNVFNVAETLPEFYLLVEKLTDIVRFNECKVSTLTISSRQGDVAQVTIGIEAESITVGQTWPTGVYPETGLPYLHSDLGDITIEGEARDPVSVSTTVDNGLDTGTFLNSLTRDETITAGDRTVTNEVELLAETANDDLLTIDAAGEAVSIVYTHAEEASSVVTIALGRVAYIGTLTTLDSKGTKTFTLSGESRALLHPGHASYVPSIRITNAHA